MTVSWTRYATEEAHFFSVLSAYRRAMRRAGWSPLVDADALAVFFAAQNMYEQPHRVGIPGNNAGGLSAVGDLGYWRARGYRLGIFSSLDAYADSALRNTWGAVVRRLGGVAQAAAHPQSVEFFANYWRYGRMTGVETSFSRDVAQVYRRLLRTYFGFVSGRDVPHRIADAGMTLLGSTDRTNGEIVVNWTGDPLVDLETVIHETYHAGGSRYSLQEGPGEENAAEAYGRAQAAQWWSRYARER